MTPYCAVEIAIAGLFLHIVWKNIIAPFVKPYRQALSAYMDYTLGSKTVDAKLVAVKTKLFHELNRTAQEKKKPLTIVEIGSGRGSNFQYFPRGANVLCIDANPHWDKYICENIRKNAHVHVERVCGQAENMTMVEDGSVDAVVCTFVLCSAYHVDAVLAETKRVLRSVGSSLLFVHLDVVVHLCTRPENVLVKGVVWIILLRHVLVPAS